MVTSFSLGLHTDSFIFSKFLGKGYKVGRVEQSETALGAEMRLAATKSNSKAKTAEEKSKDKIVRRLVLHILYLWLSGSYCAFLVANLTRCTQMALSSILNY